MTQHRVVTLLIAGLTVGCVSSRDAAPAPRPKASLYVMDSAAAPRVDTTAAATAPMVVGTQIADLGTGCDSAMTIMREAIALEGKRTDGPFKDSFRNKSRIGCRIEASGSFKALHERGGPVDLLAATFERHGWHNDVHYSADGPDGSTVGVRSRDILCIVSGSWDGGDDSEPDTATARSSADQSYDVTLECARDVPVNDADSGVPDSVWSVARRAGLDSVYAISMRMRYPPYEEGDFDGDGVKDAAVLVEKRASGQLGIAIIRRGANSVVVLGAGAGAAGPQDFTGMDEFDVYHAGTIDMSIRDRPLMPQIGDALWIGLPDKKSAFYVWTGKGFAYEPHRR